MKKQFISFLLLVGLLLLAACGNTNEKEATEPNNNKPAEDNIKKDNRTNR